MATYTKRDLEASEKFAQYNIHVRYLQLCLSKAPHLTSHLKYTIKPATDEDFYIPRTLIGKAKLLDVVVTEYLCTQKLSCNSFKEKDTCKPNEAASLYYVGDDGSYDVQCQPSCFNTKSVPVYSDKKQRLTDTPHLSWHRDKCHYVPSTYVSYLEKSYYRDEKKYVYRKNDMPTGFSRIKSKNIYGSGFDYVGNNAYCDYFGKHYNSDSDNCEMTAWEKVLDAIIGENVIDFMKSSANIMAGKGTVFDPPNLPPLPNLPDIYKLDNWKNDIDATFVAPPILTYNESPSTNLKSNNEQTIHDIRRLTEREDAPILLKRNATNIPTVSYAKVFSIEDQEKVKSMNTTNLSDTEFYNKHFVEPMLRSFETNLKANKMNWNKAKDILSKIGTGVGATALSIMSIIDPEFFEQFVISESFDAALNLIKSLAKRIVTKLPGMVAKFCSKTAVNVGEKVMASALRGVVVKIISTFAVKLASKLIIFLAQLAMAAVDVVQWILVAVMVFSFALMFWDPFGLNNMFPAYYSHEMIEGGEAAYRKAFQKAECLFDFESFVGTILTETEIQKIQIESLIDRMLYLDALVVNSDGSVIDKGDNMDFNGLDINGSNQQVIDERNAHMYKFDYNGFKLYNKIFYTRFDLLNYLNLGATATGVVAIAFCVIKLHLIAILFAILTILILYFSKIGCIDPDIVKILESQNSEFQ